LRVARRDLEKELNLEEKILDNHPYKDQIKTWTDEIISKVNIYIYICIYKKKKKKKK